MGRFLPRIQWWNGSQVIKLQLWRIVSARQETSGWSCEVTVKLVADVDHMQEVLTFKKAQIAEAQVLRIGERITQEILTNFQNTQKIAFSDIYREQLYEWGYVVGRITVSQISYLNIDKVFNEGESRIRPFFLRLILTHQVLENMIV